MSSDSRSPRDDRDPAGDESELRFKAVVEEYEDRPDQCTIYPAREGQFERMTTWITARDGSYFSLENCR
jgi:hypothetical protein